MPQVKFENESATAAEAPSRFDLALRHLQDAHRWSRDRMESRRREFARRYAQYRGNMNVFGRDPVQGQLRSQIWIGKSGSLVETVLPRTIGDNPTLELRGSRPEYVDAARNMQILTEHYLEAMDFFEVLYNWWKDALIYGTGIIKVIWSYREEERVVRDPEGIETTEMIVVEDMPRLVNVDIMDFLFDYTMPTIKKMDFVMERYELPLDIVAARLAKGIYEGITKEELKAYISTGRELERDQHYKDERDRAAYGYFGNEGEGYRGRIDPLKKVVLWDYWGRADLDGDGKDENVLITALGPEPSKVVRAVPNPYRDGQKPYVLAHYIPVQNDALGIGLMEWTEQLQREINTRYNMGVDNANYVLNAMVKVVRTASIPDAQLKSRPSGRIDVNSPDDVTPLEMPVIFDKLMAVQGQNDQLWQDITGISSEYAGVRKSQGQGFHRTAGGMYALQQAADARLKLSRLIFEKDIAAAAKLMISRIKQYMDSPVMVNILGPEGIKYIEVTPQQINGADYEVKVAIAPTEQIGKMAEREKWMLILNTLRAADPNMMLFEWGAIYSDWLEGTGIPNPQRYLGQFAEKMNMMHQISIMDQMAGGGGAYPGLSPQSGAKPGGAGGMMAGRAQQSTNVTGGEQGRAQEGGKGSTGGKP